MATGTREASNGGQDDGEKLALQSDLLPVQRPTRVCTALVPTLSVCHAGLGAGQRMDKCEDQRSSARCVDPRLVVRYTSMPLRERTKTRRSNPHVHRVEHLERETEGSLKANLQSQE